jgi:hypothetical protein
MKQFTENPALEDISGTAIENDEASYLYVRLQIHAP